MAYKKNVDTLISSAMQSRGLAEKKTMKLHQIRMSDFLWQVLSQHFETQGLSTAAGIRQVLTEYVKEKRLA